MTGFRFSLTDEEKSYLKELVRWSILRELDPGSVQPVAPEPPTEKLKEHFGAFVTLKLADSLRGCIGNVQGTKPLAETIEDMAKCAAFEDPRFPPLTRGEFDVVDIEISILSPLEPCPDPEQVEVGRHGLVMVKGMQSGLLLPQVPVEWNWDRETFLSQTCLKAGLSPDCWKDGNTTILWFEAVVF